MTTGALCHQLWWNQNRQQTAHPERIPTMPGSVGSQPFPSMRRLRRNRRNRPIHSPYWVDEDDDEPVQAKTLRQAMRTVARQAALDPGDGLELQGAMKEQLTVYLEPELMRALTEYAERRGKPKSLVAEAAIASFLSPDASERSEERRVG